MQCHAKCLVRAAAGNYHDDTSNRPPHRLDVVDPLLKIFNLFTRNVCHVRLESIWNKHTSLPTDNILRSHSLRRIPLRNFIYCPSNCYIVNVFKQLRNIQICRNFSALSSYVCVFVWMIKWKMSTFRLRYINNKTISMEPLACFCLRLTGFLTIFKENSLR